jgi:uroporphyrinogen decarboxylase
MSKKLLRVLRGERVDPPPIWLMRQAGRYLPEYRELREQAGDFLSLATIPDLATEVTLQPVRRFMLDAAILFSDILLVPWGPGQRLEYVSGTGPVLSPIRSAADLLRLSPARLSSAIGSVAQTVRRVRGALGNASSDVALIGFAGAPWTVACYMIEGRGSRDFVAPRMMAYRNAALLDGLIGLLTETTISYLTAQADAGAEAIMLFDSWAGLLPPSQFRRYILAPNCSICAAVRQRFPGLPLIGFPRLAGTMLGEYGVATGVDAAGIDTSVSPEVAASLLPSGVAVQGNLDPLAVLVGGEELEAQTRYILTALDNRPHIFNVGHGILPNTPPKHVEELVRIVRQGPSRPFGRDPAGQTAT